MKKKSLLSEESIHQSSNYFVKDDFERGLLRWECLRRNSQYIKAYSEYKNFGTMDTSWMINPKVSSEALRRVFNRKDAYSNPLVDYIPIAKVTNDNLYADFKNELLVSKAMGVIRIMGIQSWDNKKSLLSGDLRRIIEVEKIDKDGSMPFSVTIKINLEYFKEDVKETLSYALDSLYKIRDSLRGKKKRNNEYDQIKHCIKIYDIYLKNKTKKTYEQLAKDLYPTIYKNKFSAIRQVKRQVKIATDLIAGGYINIR